MIDARTFMGQDPELPLTVLYEKVDYIPTVSLGIWVNSGSRHEMAAQYGYAHLLEHMMFKAGPKAGPQKIAMLIDELGGHVNASTSREYTFYYLTVTPDLFEKGLRLLLHIVYFPIFLVRELEREKEVILEEIAMYEDSPEDYILDLVLLKIFQKSGLAHSELGTEESLGSCSVETLTDFYLNHYRSENMILSVVGPLEINKGLEKLRHVFAKEKLTIAASRSNVEKRTKRKARFYSGIYHQEKELEQVQFALTFPAYKIGDNRNYPLELMNTILGGNQSSLLFQNIREKKGLCYNISSARTSFQDIGIWGIYGASSHKRIEKTFVEILRELNKNKEKVFSKKNLRSAKNYFNINFLMSLESSDYRMFRLIRNYLIHGKYVDYDEVKRRVEKIELDEVMHIFSEIIDFNSLAVISYGRNSFDLQKILKT